MILYGIVLPELSEIIQYSASVGSSYTCRHHLSPIILFASFLYHSHKHFYQQLTTCFLHPKDSIKSFNSGILMFLFIFTTKRREWVCSSNYGAAGCAARTMEPECLMPFKYHTKVNIITKECYTNIPK